MIEAGSGGGSSSAGSEPGAQQQQQQQQQRTHRRAHMVTAASDAAAKSRRYDRQLRIWGADGQAKLEACQVCLLNSGPTGAETLKNLVLGGIAGFTVVDAAKVTASDLGNNFMVSPDSLGEPRAKVVTELVKELNDLVAGSYREEAPESMLERDPHFFAQFTVVVATQMREPDVLRLEAVCRQHGVLLLVVRSYGLAGLLRPSIPEHLITQSKPDNIVDDLRLSDPFPELQRFADSFSLDALDDVTFHHLPYVVLLLKAAQAWRGAHGGTLPASSKERAAFKDALGDLRRKADDVPLDSENFEEALRAAFHVWNKYSIGSEVRALLQDPAASDDGLSPQSADFWVLIRALRTFVEREGGGMYLPLEGSIPDMHSTTDLFLRLQRVYREKAEKDVDALLAHVQALFTLLGRQPGDISREVVRHFAKNARNLRAIRYRPIAHECGSAGVARGEALATLLASEGTSAAASLYVLFRAVDRFYALHGRFPGTVSDLALEDDVPALKSCVQQLLAEVGATGASIMEDYVLEMVRFGAGELHIIAAFMGGMAAQEIIKLVTAQFTPVGSTLVFNGVTCSTASLDL